MKGKVKKEYYKQARAKLESRLNGRNVINAINTWAVATVRYGARIMNWNKGELDKIYPQKRKLLNMDRDLHTHFSVDRLYIQRAQEGRGMLSVKDIQRAQGGRVLKTVLNWNNLTSLIMLQIKKEKLLKAATKELQIRTKIDGKNKKELENERKIAWKYNVLNGYLMGCKIKGGAVAESR